MNFELNHLSMETEEEKDSVFFLMGIICQDIENSESNSFYIRNYIENDVKNDVFMNIDENNDKLYNLVDLWTKMIKDNQNPIILLYIQYY